MVNLYLAEINVGGTHNLSQCLKGIGIVPAAFVSKECREECLYIGHRRRYAPTAAAADLRYYVKAKGSRYYLTSAGMTCETQV